MTQLNLRLIKPGEVSTIEPHQCYICDKRGHWDNNWAWYGGLDDQNNADKLCSVECRDKYNKKHHIPLPKRKFSFEVEL